MAKTKQIGVRFDEDLLKTLKEDNLATSPQKALNLYERSYLELIALKVEINNGPESKELKFMPPNRKKKDKVDDEVLDGAITYAKAAQSFDGPKMNQFINDEAGQTPFIPPMPVRQEGEDAFDFAARKNEWKKKYNL